MMHFKIQKERLFKFNQSNKLLIVNLYTIIGFLIKEAFVCDTVFFSTFKT